MLYKESKEYLLDKLKAAGLKSKPYTTQKGLEKSQESHIGAVLFESETLLRNGSKTRYRDQEGAQKKRRKVFDRALTFTVIIGDYTDEAVESMFGAFLSSLDRGIYVNGDYVPIEVEGADWVDKDDSILKAQVAVQIRIRFDGGLYRDTNFAKVTDVEVESISPPPFIRNSQYIDCNKSSREAQIVGEKTAGETFRTSASFAVVSALGLRAFFSY